jgi:hypothetical protein
MSDWRMALSLIQQSAIPGRKAVIVVAKSTILGIAVESFMIEVSIG